MIGISSTFNRRCEENSIIAEAPNKKCNPEVEQGTCVKVKPDNNQLFNHFNLHFFSSEPQFNIIIYTTMELTKSCHGDKLQVMYY